MKNIKYSLFIYNFLYINTTKSSKISPESSVSKFVTKNKKIKKEQKKTKHT